MPSIIDYLYWRGDLSLRDFPFNDVDNLILSQLAYVQPECAGLAFGCWTLKDMAPALIPCAEAFGTMSLDETRRMLELMAAGARFSDAVVCRYAHSFDEECEKQFAAMTVQLDDGVTYVAFRGTDNTMVGWKEDFNMAYLPVVPAQMDALAYLLAEAAEHAGPLRVGGHSKGGNLAVYAASCAPEDVQDRILAVYSNDGPGMSDESFQSPGYRRVVPKVRSIIPDFSIVGMLLHEHEVYTVVKSCVTGLMQHDPFTWQTARDGFVTAESLSPLSARLDETLDTWMAEVPPKEREELVDCLFSVFGDTKQGFYSEMRRHMPRRALEMLFALRRASPETRRRMRQLAFSLAGAFRGPDGDEKK